MVRTRSSLLKFATQEQSKTASSSSRRHITTNNNHHDNNGENQTSASQSRGKTNSTSDEHDCFFKPSASSLVHTNMECSKDGSVNSENQKHDESETTKPLKRVSFSSSVADEEEKESPNSALRKRKQRDIAKLIISPAEPIGHIIVYSNVKQSVRPDSMTLWIDPMGSRDTLTALKFGSNPVTTNIQIKRAVNRKWPIFPEHCTLTHDGNSTVLLLEKEAMVVVNGQYYKNSRTAEKNVICVDKVIIDYGDIIDLDGRLFIYVKHNLPSYFASYQQMFMNYVENKNMKRKREDEGDDENESAVKKEKLLLYSQEDETTTEDTDEEQDLDEEEQIDSEELQNVISEMGDEEIEDYGHLNDLDLETDDMTLQTEDNNIPCFVSSPQKDNDDKILDEANPIQSQEDGDLEHIIGADLYQEIIEKLNVEVFKQMEEKEKEFMKKIEHLEKALKEEKERASQHSHQLEKQIETLKNNLKDREEEIEEHKRALEKSKLQIEKNDAQRKDNEKLKFKTTDMEKKLQEKINAQETLLNENKLLRQQIATMKKNLQQQEASTVSLKNTFDNKEKELEKLRLDFSSYINFVQTKIGEIQALPREIIRTVNQHDPIEDDTIIFSADEIESSQNVPNHTMINKQPKREIKRPLQFGKSQPKLLLPLNSTKKNLVEPSKSKNDEYKDYENLSDEDFEI